MRTLTLRLVRGWQFVYEGIKKDVQFASISGGTDLNGCFALGCTNLPGISFVLDNLVCMLLMVAGLPQFTTANCRRADWDWMSASLTTTATALSSPRESWCAASRSRPCR